MGGRRSDTTFMDLLFSGRGSIPEYFSYTIHVMHTLKPGEVCIFHDGFSNSLIINQTKIGPLQLYEMHEHCICVNVITVSHAK